MYSPIFRYRHSEISGLVLIMAIVCITLFLPNLWILLNVPFLDLLYSSPFDYNVLVGIDPMEWSCCFWSEIKFLILPLANQRQHLVPITMHVDLSVTL